ncbi:DUF1192 domain-containing protein [Novosphingobium profundi]|uniref:DUF1192 domain-containing protein n=1 Tax=Novosphingobium profundi TaxID=1774954 RepID=UPI001BDA6202|nr:DUF1192 domain-containing protein [Novosphingobium profundi]MBT0668827.1 DUF1192 domain-containing protein [Novosphingobium profundi]
MDDDERPRPRPSEQKFGAASLLSGENLDSYSLDELDARKALLETEISRITAHRARAASHRLAAEALFGKAAAPAPSSPPDPFRQES